MASLRRLYRRRVPELWRRRLTLRTTRRDLRSALHMRRHNRALPDDAPVLNFFPGRPPANAKILKAMKLLGIRIGLAARADQPTIAWEGRALFAAGAVARLPGNAINRRCLDLSKSHVDRTWAEVAGYSISVDPFLHDDVMVVKSEENGMHDGRLVIGPLERRREGYVYQRLIDSREAGWIKNMRVFIVGSEMPLVFDVWRQFPHWFESVGMAMPRQAHELLSPPEIELIMRFARALGMDYGEMDVVRDRHSGLIYGVDANRTPLQGALLTKADEPRTYRPLAAALGRMLAAWQPLEGA
jgi:hypothetical protein